MIQTNIQNAETNLAQLIEKAIAGEDVIIEASETQQVKLVPIEPQEIDWFGMDEGKGWIADDFDRTPQDLIEAFEGR